MNLHAKEVLSEEWQISSAISWRNCEPGWEGLEEEVKNEIRIILKRGGVF